MIDWHPVYIEGTGHTKGEGCEHIFSSSNVLACSTRHASPFYRHQAISPFGTRTNMQPLVSTFLHNHYQEALTAVQTLTAELATLKGVLNLSDTDFLHFHEQERSYLDGLKELPLKDQVSIRYIQALDEVAERQTEWNSACESANRSLMEIHIGSFQEMHTALNQAWVRVEGAHSRLQNAESMASHLEVQLGIDKWWEVGSDHYNHFREEASLLNYRTALDELEWLVIMRLFELSKLSLSGTGRSIIL
ncbi:hypothetical protein C8R48DRAFT_747867 [Suillus tomentosus]|nr:hypothetical protein C8R48DRAFT_747867 [Suillus tomentosus]